MALARYTKGHEIMAADGFHGLNMTSSWQAGDYHALPVESITRGDCHCNSVPTGMFNTST